MAKKLKPYVIVEDGSLDIQQTHLKKVKKKLRTLYKAFVETGIDDTVCGFALNTEPETNSYSFKVEDYKIVVKFLSINTLTKVITRDEVVTEKEEVLGIQLEVTISKQIEPTS